MSSETMYDRLGDLLSKTLETGFVKTAAPGKKVKDGARKKNTEQKLRSAAEQNQTATRRENTATRRENTATRRENTANRRENTATHENTSTHENRQSFVYHSAVKKITPELARAYRLLGITFSATTEDVKKAYKEKIKYYHPDRHTVNAVMQKIATDKTRQVVEAFTLIMKFLEQ